MSDPLLQEPARESAYSSSTDFVAAAWGLLGFAVGSAVGVAIFYLGLKSGVYAIVIPGAVAGMFCGGFMGRRIGWMGIVCGVLGLILTLATEWKFHPFVRDPGLEFFLEEVWKLPPFRLLLFAAGGLLAGWFGMGRDGSAWFRRGRRG